MSISIYTITNKSKNMSMDDEEYWQIGGKFIKLKKDHSFKLTFKKGFLLGVVFCLLAFAIYFMSEGIACSFNI